MNKDGKIPSMIEKLRTAIVLLLTLTGLTGLLYPLAVTGIAQLFFEGPANGSILEREGVPVGSRLIGQEFRSPKYFWSRLSATGPVPYNGAASTGSNYGPLNGAMHEAAAMRVEGLKGVDPGNERPIPVDLVTASSSGLDPHISPASAYYQVPRVAHERRLTEARVRSLVDEFTEARDIGFLGEAGVNVLRLNLALDDLSNEEGVE
jgi:K+-transporting ATPase ATPase C chain